MTARFFSRLFGLVVLPLVASCGATLSDADKSSIAKDGIEIAVCQAEAAQCKAATSDASAVAGTCWPVYDACMTAHGLRDAGDE